jgi:macrolide transport system ATP-binding/permease protein
MLKDLRYACRMLRKNPLFTAIAVCSLAIGIGANSAIFSLADAILLRPLPVLHPSQIVNVEMTSPSDPREGVSYRDYVDFRDKNRSFGSMVGHMNGTFGFSAKPDALPQVKFGLFVTGNFFQALGVQPALGRGFRLDEDQAPGRDAVVVLSHDIWVRQFASNPGVVGQRVLLNGKEFTVVGVTAKQFTGVDVYWRPAFYVPMAMVPTVGQPDFLEKRDARHLTVRGRLKPGVSLSQAQSDLASIAAVLKQTFPATNRNQGVSIRTELESRIEDDPPDANLMAMLLALSFCVLMVACANVAGLLLSRSRARAREIAVRLAIGAGRTNLIRQLLTESLLIAMLGGAVGVAIAYGGVQFFGNLKIPTDLPIVIAPQLDGRLLLFTLIVSLGSTVLFGLAPALRSTRPDLVPSLKSADSNVPGRSRLWGRNSLVIGQIAVSLILMIVSGLLFKSFRETLGGGPGFRTDHLIMMGFDPSLVRYTPEQCKEFYKQLIEKVRSAPGVTSATLASATPMAPDQNGETVVPEGYQLPAGKEAVSAWSSTVDEHYLETMGIPLTRGRNFQTSDTASSPRVAIINNAFANRYWPNQDAVGKRFHLGNANGPMLQIVGIARTSKVLWIAEAPTEFLYLPLAQNPRLRMNLIAQTGGDAAGLTPVLREAVRQIDPNQPIYNVMTMEDFYTKRAVQVPNMIIETVAVLGLTGVILAMIGLYGLVAFSVARRTREIGIRMAIGAEKTQVLGMVLRQGLVLAVIGVGIGLAGGVVASRFVDAVFAINPLTPDTSKHAIDFPVFVVTALAMLGITLMATYAPARRASMIDPMRALRDE